MVNYFLNSLARRIFFLSEKQRFQTENEHPSTEKYSIKALILDGVTSNGKTLNRRVLNSSLKLCSLKSCAVNTAFSNNFKAPTFGLFLLRKTKFILAFVWRTELLFVLFRFFCFLDYSSRKIHWWVFFAWFVWI